jgi:hypothetical protein
MLPMLQVTPSSLYVMHEGLSYECVLYITYHHAYDKPTPQYTDTSLLRTRTHPRTQDCSAVLPGPTTTHTLARRTTQTTTHTHIHTHTHLVYRLHLIL